MKQRTHKKAWAALTAALTLCLAAGCAANKSQPVVTSDELLPFSTSVRAENEQPWPAFSVPEEKTCAYIWPPEDIEASAEKLRQQITRAYQEAYSNAEELKAKADTEVECARNYWEKQRAVAFSVSPQEAANRAGVVFETFYGIDLADKVLRMECRAHANYGGDVDRPVWRVYVGDACDDGVSIELPAGAVYQARCEVDAITEEIVSAQYFTSYETYTEIVETPMADCFTPISPDSPFGRWDAAHPNFGIVKEALMEKLMTLISGSIFTNGAAVTLVECQLENIIEKGETVNRLKFYLTCEDGKIYELLRDRTIQPYLEYDFCGYPLRAYTIYDSDYMIMLR